MVPKLLVRCDPKLCLLERISKGVSVFEARREVSDPQRQLVIQMVRMFGERPNRLVNGVAACGWVVQGGFAFGSNSVVQWTTLLTGSILLSPGISSFEAEPEGIEGGSWASFPLLKPWVGWSLSCLVFFSSSGFLPLNLHAP